MAIVSDVEIRLRADIARLQSDLTRARQQVSGFTSSVKSMVGGLFAGLGAGLLVTQVAGAQREFEKLRASLITVTGSSKEAGKAFEAIQKFAAATPFSVQEVTEGFLKLRNLGLTPSERALESYGNTAAAMGKSLNQMIEAVADAATGEFERLKEFGVKAKQNGDQVALTFQGVTKTIGNNAADIEAYLMAIGEVQFAGGMSRQADTLDGDLSNLKDTWNTTLVAFSQGSGFGDLLRGSIQALSASLSDLGAMFAAVGGAAEDEGKKVEAITPLHKFLTTVFEALTVVGVNVAYVFKTIGKDIGAFAAQAVALFNGGFSGMLDGSTVKAMKDISNARVEDAKRERAEVDATSERILGAAAKNQAARAKDEADRKAKVEGVLGGYKIQGEAVKKVSDAEKKAATEATKDAAKRLQAYGDMQAAMRRNVEESAREAAGMAPLNDAQKYNLDLTEKLAAGKVKLSKDQEAYLRGQADVWAGNIAEAESKAALVKMDEALYEIHKAASDTRAEAIKQASEEAQGNERLAATFGMTAAAIAQMEIARLKEQLAQRSSVGMTLDEIEHLEQLIALKERSAKAVADTEAMDSTKQFWTDIEKTAHDTFVSIADGGKGAFQRLKETAKNTFFDWLYQQTLKKWIINIGTASAGTAGVSGIANAATGGGGIMSGLSSILGGGTSALGSQLGTSIANVLGPTVSGAISSGLSTLAAAAPWVAGAVALYSVAKKAFGMGPKEFTGTATLSGWINGNGGLDANKYADWEKQGGWLRGDKSGSDRQAIDGELAKGILTTYDTIKASTTEYAKALGLNADHIANRAQGISIALGKDEAANQKAITQFFSDAADHVAREVLPSMDLFTHTGETAAQTLQRMAVNAAGVEQIFASMGTTTAAVFGQMNNVSMQAREALVALAGGLESLASQTAFYNQNFLTRAEQIAPIQREVNEQLAALGYAGITTTEQFKGAVQGLLSSGALATEQGAATYAGLLAMAPKFKAVADYLKEIEDAKLAEATARLEAEQRAAADAAEDLARAQRDQADAARDAALEAEAAAREAAVLARSRRDLEIQIMDAQGDAVGALAARREDELAATDASLQSLVAHLHALGDQKVAADAAARALGDQKVAADAAARALQENEGVLRGLVDAALSAVGRAVTAQKNLVVAAYADAMAGLDKSIARVNGTIERTGELSKLLAGSYISGPADSVGGASRAAASAQITAALALAKTSGVLPSADDLRDALATLGQDGSDQFASLADYQRSIARTNAEIEQLGGLTDDQLSTAQRQLLALEDRKTQAGEAHRAELQRLDDMVSWAQAQVDATKGVDNTVMGVAQAMAGMRVALEGLRVGATTGNPGGKNLSVEDLYRTVLGREGEAAGVEFWKKAFGASVDASEYAQFVKGAVPELEMQRRAEPPMVAAGLGSGTMGGSSASVEQQQINARTEAAMARTATAVEQLASQFNKVTAGGNALLTEPA